MPRPRCSSSTTRGPGCVLRWPAPWGRWGQRYGSWTRLWNRSLSYVAIADPEQPLIPEAGQPALWMRLDQDWESCFPDDAPRIRRYVEMLRSDSAAG